MKKFALLLLMVMCAASAVKAQNVYLVGAGDFWHNDEGDEDYTIVSIAPEIGVRLGCKWALGTELSYTFLNDKGVKNNTFVVAPYARYSLVERGCVSLFIDSGFGFSYTKEKGKDSDTGFEIGWKPGVAIKLTDHFSLIAKTGFLGYRDDYRSDPTGNGFGLGINNKDMKFGFQLSF